MQDTTPAVSNSADNFCRSRVAKIFRRIRFCRIVQKPDTRRMNGQANDFTQSVFCFLGHSFAHGNSIVGLFRPFQNSVQHRRATRDDNARPQAFPQALIFQVVPDFSQNFFDAALDDIGQMLLAAFRVGPTADSRNRKRFVIEAI